MRLFINILHSCLSRIFHCYWWEWSGQNQPRNLLPTHPEEEVREEDEGEGGVEVLEAQTEEHLQPRSVGEPR